MNYLRINIFFSILFMLLSCHNTETENKVSPNDKIFGMWQYNDKLDSYIIIKGDEYEEHLGEISSTITGNIFWQDTSHYIIVIKKSTGAIAKTVHPKDKFNIEIIELNETSFRFRVSNMDVQPIIELSKVSSTPRYP